MQVRCRHVQKVAFTKYPVQDWKRARAFYGETLGLKIGSKSPDGVWTEYDLPGGGCLALFGNKDMKPYEDAGASVALEVDDLDKLNAELKAKGVRYIAAESIDRRRRHHVDVCVSRQRRLRIWNLGKSQAEIQFQRLPVVGVDEQRQGMDA